MNLSKQIKQYRSRDQLSQEELACKLYVSRQTISNWENEKSYPDIHNLLLLSVLFNVSLDELVKGDVAMMKNEIQNAEMNKWTIMMVVFMIIGPLSAGPAMFLFGNKGLIISFAFIVLSIIASMKVEKIKKRHHLKTYKDILAFQEGRQTTKSEKEQARKYDKYVLAAALIISGLVSGTLVLFSMYLFN